MAKVLSSRLKAVMHDLISENQTAFLVGRQIIDGFLVANEAVHSLKRYRVPSLIFKVDFHKAFDSVCRTCAASRRSSTLNVMDIYLVNVGRQGILCLLAVKNGVGVAT